jgi:hypothetical protein
MYSLFAVLVVLALAQAKAVAYQLDLTCNENGGTVAHDSSTNCFDFQVNGATWTRGIVGNGLQFDGMEAYIGTTNPMCLGRLGSFREGTIGVSFRLDMLPLNTVEPIFYFGNPNGSSIIIEVGHYNTESKLYFTVRSNGIPLCFDSNLNLQTNVWYRFAVVVGTNFNTGYLNGLELTNRHYNYGDARTSFFLANVDRSLCWLGKGYSSGATQPSYFDGQIDEFRIYQRTLDSQEMAAFYTSFMSVAGVSLERQGASGVLLRWPSHLRQQYNVFYRMNLASVAQWLMLGSNVPGAEPETIFLDTNGVDVPSGFYRVSRSPY